MLFDFCIKLVEYLCNMRCHRLFILHAPSTRFLTIIWLFSKHHDDVMLVMW